jgi:phytoene synthase
MNPASTNPASTIPAELAPAYRRWAQLNRRRGSSFYWATWLLPPPVRPHVHALYGFCRCADDIVDEPGPASPQERRHALEQLGGRLFSQLETGPTDDPQLGAVVHTARTFGLDPACFHRFLDSMAMDLQVSRYGTFDQLLRYMDGSAAVIGEMLLPLLDASGPEAGGPARDLGVAFQLTNFLRDVVEDLDRGRVYLPREDIDRFGAASALDERRVTPAWVELMRFEIGRARQYYRSADRGLALLPPASARCVGAARRLYSGILECIEAAGYDVFGARARVARWRKLVVAAPLLRARPAPEATDTARPAPEATDTARPALEATGTANSIP